MKITVKHISNLSLSLGELFILPWAPASQEKGAAEKGSGKGRKSGAQSALKMNPTLRELDKTLNGLISFSVQQQDYKPGKGKRLNVYLPHKGKTVRVVGMSPTALRGEAGSLDEWRKVGGDAVAQARALKSEQIIISLDGAESAELDSIIDALVEGMLLGSYEFKTFKRSGSDWSPKTVTLVGTTLRSSGRYTDRIKNVAAVCQSIATVRDLVNTPPNVLTTKSLVAMARKIAAMSPRLSLKLYNESALQRLGANALLAVGRASAEEPYLIHLTYKPRQKNRRQKRVVLIGKGITFDSGGLSIKPAKGMEDMKCDMAGAAAVLGVMRALATAKDLDAHRHEIHVIVPTAENMINGRAMRPGDIERAMNGKTIEILNTDAEGRLILADALCYADRLKPEIVIDLATLTGACVVALGNDYAGMFTNDEQLQNGLLQASERSGEKLWPLPLADEYRPSLDSSVADMKNIGDGTAGAIIGALFLREFVPDKAQWAHLDIAGPAFWSKSNEYIKRGGTGFGVRTLLQFLETL